LTHLHETIDVPCPIDLAFSYTSNFANIEQWDPGVVASKRLSSGPIGKGSEFEVTVKFGPRSTAMHYTILDYEPPHRVVLEGRADSVHALDEIRFEETSDGCRIDYQAEISLKGIGGTLEPLLGGVLDKVGKKAVGGLHKALSGSPEVPAESATRNLLDRLILPGAVGFTRLGYEHRKKSWKPLATRLDGKTAIVTGANSGLGRETSERLAELGARVIMVGRNPASLQQAMTEIAETTGSTQLGMKVADLSLVSEVKKLGRQLLKEEDSIHILVNNAAVLPLERTLTAENLETTFTTDLLSPYLLTELLLPRLKQSAPSRIINVLSGGMYLARLNLEDLQNEKGEFDGARAYARAKRGLMMMTETWTEQLHGSGVAVNAMHPGWANTPGVEKSLPAFHRQMNKLLRSPKQGADTIVWLAAAPEATEVSGKFWLDREPHLSAIFPGTAGSPDDRRQLRSAMDQLAKHIV
jgi:NAD(P)-dependent dehydrogenase (short-subunit alcohol dehydrogenase family)/uncharacterized protein YndB with AHSA1/START domain